VARLRYQVENYFETIFHTLNCGSIDATGHGDVQVDLSFFYPSEGPRPGAQEASLLQGFPQAPERELIEEDVILRIELPPNDDVLDIHG